jgi:hypothetical protein
MSRRSNLAKHAAWTAAQRAGQLRNGRQRVGQTLGGRKSKAALNRRACRGPVVES